MASVMACCSAMPTSYMRWGNSAREAVQAGAGGHARGDGHDPRILAGDAQQLGDRHGRVVGRPLEGRRACAADGVASPSLVPGAEAGRTRHRRQGRAVEADLVRLGRPEAVALLRAHVDDDGALVGQGPPEGRVERLQVVPGHRTDVGDAQVLEQLARAARSRRPCPQPPRPLEGLFTHDRQPPDGPVVGALRSAPRPRQLDARQVLAQRADRRRDAHLVVVEHDHHARLAVAQVVEGLQRQTRS